MGTAGHHLDLVPDFSVVLGADYAGKSSVLSMLAGRSWRCVSYDESLLPAGHNLINELRDGVTPAALRLVGSVYSRDFALTVLQTAVVYLRDQVLRAQPGDIVVVDSFYYKILAKCRLTGLVNEDLFRWWRSFPQPSEIVYLDVDPSVAWSRSGDGLRLNRFEHYGDEPTWRGFRRFQLDLRDVMFEEIHGIRTTVLEQQPDIAATAAAVKAVMRTREDTIGVG
ncbi:hypothetical protein [Kibdelosporangium aridum]|uniref:hypothetical protein n=1 Tax=Kibdelosporangium aridum TaxID=2030 RepID=UPI0006914B57